MKILTVFILALLPLISFGTGQQPDILKYDGAEYKLTIFPLAESPIIKREPLTHPIPEDYKAPIRFTLSTNSTHYVISTGNYRGYVATWEIKDNQLYLTRIYGWIVDTHMKLVPSPTQDDPDRWTTETTYTHRKATVELLFPEQVCDGKVPATWFSGELFTGGWNPGMQRSPEVLDEQKKRAKLVFVIKNGVVESVIDNRTPNQKVDSQ